MKTTYLFEAGATKTTLLVKKADEIITYNLPGFNPNRYTPDFETALTSQINIPNNADVYFYGSGLVEERNKKIVQTIFLKNFNLSIYVFDDLQGAARAVCGNNKGLVAIMGTGGVVAFYDGHQIIQRNGGYGYLIDDIGGGFELGKLIISAWLNNQLPETLDSEITSFVNVNKDQFIGTFYQNVDLNLLAAVVKLIPPYVYHDTVNKLVKSYFDTFFERHIIPLKIKYASNELSIVGSVGLAFEETLREVALTNDIQILKFDSQPAKALLAYHTSLPNI